MAIEVTQTDRVVAIVELLPNFNRPLPVAGTNSVGSQQGVSAATPVVS